MFRPQDHLHNLSLRLSHVMADIGVTESLAMKRKTWLQDETTYNIFNKLVSSPICLNLFGSQVEGTTILRLNSDTDCLCCNISIRLIQDWSDWEAGHKMQLLMVQDNFSGILSSTAGCLQTTQHGPATTLDRRGHGGCEFDFVEALTCDNWPKEAHQWLQRENRSGWPTQHEKRYSVEHGCFVVPVASRTCVNPDLEWRISTCHAERCLMFSLSMTQIRCYILMKMILKTFISPKCNETISSYMCKTVLFYCVADSANIWEDCGLVTCLKSCLELLLNFVLTKNCPHFIMPNNNLLAGKLTAAVQQQVVDILCALTEDIEQCLLRINIDNLGSRLFAISSGITQIQLDYVNSRNENRNKISVNLHAILRRSSLTQLQFYLSLYNVPVETILQLIDIYTENESKFVKSAISYVIPYLSTSIGCLKGSEDIQHSRTLSLEAAMWFSLGLNSDFSSSKLKMASTLYCTRDIAKCELVLKDLEEQFNRSCFIAICSCYTKRIIGTSEFARLCAGSDDNMINRRIAFCTSFKPYEMNCVPVEMRYEMFRSTENDRGPLDYWMDCAVVDSQPFLYFLQYKVYSQLHRPQDQRRALLNLAFTIENAHNLGHKETALNLLGQCMEQANRKDIALQYYMASLNVRARNNAANWHVCRVLAGFFR